MNRHERRAAGDQKVACRIRAKRCEAGACFFCTVAAGAGGLTQAALALVYFKGHQDEAAALGPPLCDTCLDLLQSTAERLTAIQGGELYNMNAPGAGKA